MVSTHGRHCVVEQPDGRRLICHPRGKKSEVVVGDHVTWHLTQEQADEGIIVKIDDRQNLLYRQDEWRSKSFAANLDLLLMWIAGRTRLQRRPNSPGPSLQPVRRHSGLHRAQQN